MSDKLLGRPRKILDTEKITELIGKGFTVQFVAEFFNVAPSTLYLNYSECLRRGFAFRNGCLQAKQFENALMGNATLQVWLGKQWLKQRDPIDKQPPVPIEIATEHRVVIEVVNQVSRPVRPGKEDGVSTSN